MMTQQKSNDVTAPPDPKNHTNKKNSAAPAHPQEETGQASLATPRRDVMTPSNDATEKATMSLHLSTQNTAETKKSLSF
jgi:hypothetical protein